MKEIKCLECDTVLSFGEWFYTNILILTFDYRLVSQPIKYWVGGGSTCNCHLTNRLSKSGLRHGYTSTI